MTAPRCVDYYDARIFPVLTPLAVDPAHPFPYISNLALSIAAHVADPDTGERRFVRLKIPDVFPRLLTLGDGRFVPAEEVVAAHLHTLFVGMIVEEWAMFRVTRNADLTFEDDEADDLLEAVELELRRRRFNKAIRLEVADNISDELLDLLVRELELDLRNVSRHRALIDLSCLMAAARPRPSRPQGSGLAPGDGRPVAERRGCRAARSSPSSATGRCSSTTRTRASPAAPRGSSSRRPPTAGCSRSR